MAGSAHNKGSNRSAAAVRVVRSSPVAGLGDAAHVAGVDVGEVRSALAALASRGGCAAAAAAAATGGGVGRMVGLAHRACPPPVTRLAADPARSRDLDISEVLTLRGPSRWGVFPTLISTIVEARQSAATRPGCPPRLLTALAADPIGR